tara:strand:+ start:680 stop:1339 length:660 start_codon:yes stop_codon:yes gene_type:complete
MLGIRVEVAYSLSLDPKRPVVFLGNHPRLFEIPAYAKAVLAIIRRRNIVPIVKSELQRTPFGLAAVFLGALPIKREKGVHAVATIHRWAKKQTGFPAIVLYPDGTRATRKKQQRVKEILLEKYNDPKKQAIISRICSVTIPPKVAGLHALLMGLENPQCVLVRVKNNRGVTSLFDLWKNGPPTCVSVVVEGIQITSEDSQVLQDELFNLWDKKVVSFLR